ncbi:MAG: hypothetical protein GX913_01750 [Clostridiales bacterium]|nr:hypothetical protein [Clostridiales bacterium]
MAKKNVRGREASMEEKSDNKFLTVFFTLLIIVIWLAIFAVLVKIDVGGFGSTVLRPIFKDVPIINQILPRATDEEKLEGNNYPYKNLAEAIEYIKELELELQTYQLVENLDASSIAELQAEVERLKIFEEKQIMFEDDKARFYDEVVFNENAPEIGEYQTWYESINPVQAELLYRQVVEQITYTEATNNYASTYGSMKPAQASQIFQEMTGDLDTVALILNTLSVDQRGAILGAMAAADPTLAAKITQLLVP